MMVSNNGLDKNYCLLGQIYNILWNYSQEKWILYAVENILDRGLNINYALPAESMAVLNRPRWHGYTALHFAVELSQSSVIELLLNRGADFTILNGHGFTALQMVIENRNFLNQALLVSVDHLKQYIWPLLRAHLRSNNTTNPCSRNGISHLHIACLANEINVVQLFLSGGADINKPVDFDSPELPGFTPLHFAAKYRNYNVVKLLLENNANPCLKDRCGITPIHILVEHSVKYADFLRMPSTEKQHAEFRLDIANIEFIMKKILEKIYYHSVNPIIYGNLFHLHICCMQSHVNEDLKNLLKHNADINVPVELDSPKFPGYLPLHFASHFSYDLVLELVNSGANLTAKDANGVTPVDLIVTRYRNERTCNLILKTLAISKNDKRFFQAVFAMESQSIFDDFVSENAMDGHVSFKSPVWPGCTLLHLAVRFASNEIIDRCLSMNPQDVTSQDAEGMTPLHLVVYMNKYSLIKQMLHIHANNASNPENRDGLSHFHIACLANEPKLVDTFLLAGANTNCAVTSCFDYLVDGSIKHIVKGSTFLHLAVISCAREIVGKLLSYDADPTLLNANGESPLHLALVRNKVQLLEQFFSSPKAVTANPKNHEGYTHLHAAIIANNLLAVKALSRIEPKEAIKKIDEKCIKCELDIRNKTLKWNPGPLNGVWIFEHYCDPEYSTLSYKMVNFLLNGDVSLALNREHWPTDQLSGYTLLHAACHHRNVHEIKSLLERGADPNAQISSHSKRWPGYTPLHLIIHMCCGSKNWPEDIVHLLLEYGADMTIPNGYGETPLHLECIKFRTTRLLLVYNDNPVSRCGLSHFHLMCQLNEVAAAKKFIDYRIADINAATDFFISTGLTPLHSTIRDCNERLTKILLEYGADIMAEDIHGKTPLHYAAQVFPEILELLLSTGKADISARTTRSETIMELALLNGNAMLDDYFLLLSYGAKVNIFNPIKEIGVLSIAIDRMDEESFEAFAQKVSDLRVVDSQGRNAVHNIISQNKDIYKPFMSSSKRYERAIELLLKHDCDIDKQDDKGNTPLHTAVNSKNFNGASTLLTLGADINIEDNIGRTPYYLSTHAKGIMNAPLMDWIFEEISNLFRNHLTKLIICQLHVNELNWGCIDLQNNPDFSRIIAEIKKMSVIKIDKWLSFRDILSEKWIKNYPRMNVHRRQSIIQYIQNFKGKEKFPLLWPLVRLQCRKAMARNELLKRSNVSLKNILGHILPDLCLHQIIFHLNNDELKKLISEN